MVALAMGFESHTTEKQLKHISKKIIMHEQSQNIRDEKMFRFASAKRYLKIFVPEFAFKHDDYK